MGGVEDTARLILMEQRDAGERSLYEFAQRIKSEHPDVVANEITRLWSRYMGMDGRIRPTHNLDTGLPR